MKRYKKKATTYDSMPWANSSFDRKYCRSTMRNYRLILDADDENWFKQRKAELVQKLKALKASLEKSKENSKVRRAIKAVGIMIAMISASALGFLVHKVISRKLGSDANKPVNELVNELTSNIQPVIEAANTNSVPQQTANLCKSSANDLSQFSKGVKEILRKYGKQSAYSSSDFMEEPLMKRIQPPSPSEPTIPKTVNARKELSNTLRSVSSDIGNAKSIIKRVSSDTLKKNPTLRSDLLSAINKLSTAERAVNTNVFESDFTKKHAEMSSRMVNEALNAVKSALNDFNGYETDKDEQAINTVLSHIQSASNKLKSVKVLDSKRVRLDSNADIKRYIDMAVREGVEQYVSYLRDAGVKGMKKGQHVKARDPEYLKRIKGSGGTMTAAKPSNITSSNRKGFKYGAKNKVNNIIHSFNRTTSTERQAAATKAAQKQHAAAVVRSPKKIITRQVSKMNFKPAVKALALAGAGTAALLAGSKALANHKHKKAIEARRAQRNQQ